jgi:predicted enzyme related to lactoylglutathione lyase
MKRVGFQVVTAALLGALAACGSDSKASQSTTPVVAEPAPVAEAPPPVEPAAEPARPAEPPAPTYLAGKWVWHELTTSDVAKAKDFYGQIFGWTLTDKEMGGQKYTAIVSNGKEIGLVQALPADAKKQKLTPAWAGYVSVPDVDAAVTAATGKGAKVAMAAMDVPEIGRFAVLTDPSGASFGVVKAAKGDEPDSAPSPGSFVWLEHWSKDAAKTAEAAAFYTAVSGYETETMKMGKDDYTLAKASGAPRLGLGKAPKPNLAGKFVPYVLVPDTDTTVKQATKLKAKVLVKANDIPNVGRIAVLADPQGSAFGIMSPLAPAAAPAGATDTGEGKADGKAGDQAGDKAGTKADDKAENKAAKQNDATAAPKK